VCVIRRFRVLPVEPKDWFWGAQEWVPDDVGCLYSKIGRVRATWGDLVHSRPQKRLKAWTLALQRSADAQAPGTVLVGEFHPG
jgi:hypothetical protein